MFLSSFEPAELEKDPIKIIKFTVIKKPGGEGLRQHLKQ